MKVSAKNPLEFWGLALGDKSAEMNKSFEDSNIEIIDSIYRSNQRIITLQKRLFKHYCPICSHIMHSKGIYTRTINHPIMQDGGKYKEAKEKLKDIISEYDNCPYDMFHTIADSLRYHFDAIANSFIMVERHYHGDTYIKRLSNGSAEALNRIVKDMKHNGRGYKNFTRPIFQEISINTPY